MSDELFSAVTARRARPLPTFVPRCGHCGLYKRCESPKMRVDGEGRRGILIVGEWPGRSEDGEGRPFVGGSGRFLARELQKFGVDMRRDCWLTNALVCAPIGEAPAGAIDDCRPNLLKAIRDLNPTSIFLMGGAAIQAAVGHFWKPDVGPVGRWTGRRIPNHNPNAWVCPFNNPAHLLRDGAHPVELLQFRDSLGAAVALEGRPWANGPPDYRSKVETILSPADAAAALKAVQSGVIAFDLETTTLKPDSAESRIVCCSVCHEGCRTIAFPWQGPAVVEMSRILRSPEIPKIGYNCFSGDTRFLTREFGVVSFAEVVGKYVTVLNREGRWVSASICSFGHQPVRELTFVRRNYKNTVRVTDNHRWILSDGTEKKSSQLLKTGSGHFADAVDVLRAPAVELDVEEYIRGVRHGAVYGDGACRIARKNTYVIRLCGDKRQLLPFFEGFSVCSPPSYRGDLHVSLPDQAVDLKAVPSPTVSDSYAVGFIRGVLATDGTVSMAGQISVSGGSDLLDWLRQYAPRVGYWTQGVTDFSKYEQAPDSFKRTKQVWGVTFSRDCITLDDLLLEKHRARHSSTTAGPYKFSARGDERSIEEVFCAVVPDGETFTLDGGLVTGNCKFELRWIMAKLGFPVANWLWDGMLAAHALDARRGRGDDRAGQTTGLKFQSYCLLGAPDYSGHLDDLLRPAKDDAGGNDPNEIRRIDMRELCIYCGIDSFLEWKVAQIQMREIGVGREP